MPQPPNTIVCVLDIPRNEAICGHSDENDSFRVPLIEMDCSVAFQPEEWGKVRTYIKTLESWVRDNCAGN